MPEHVSSPIRSLGILTGGGDVPGLNAAIKTVVYRAEPMGIRIVGCGDGAEAETSGALSISR